MATNQATKDTLALAEKSFMVKASETNLSSEQLETLEALMSGESFFGEVKILENKWTMVPDSTSVMTEKILAVITGAVCIKSQFTNYNGENIMQARVSLINGSYFYLNIHESCVEAFKIKEKDILDPASIVVTRITNGEREVPILYINKAKKK